MSALLLASVVLAGAAAQDPIDSRWIPWLGCWELVDDQRRDPLIGEADPTEGQHVPERGLVCLNPSPDGAGVTVTTAADGNAFFEETLIADGQKNPSTKGSCSGWQRTEWSQDGHRLFTTAELTCDENRELKVSGLSMMVPRETWVDIQIVESDAGRAVVIRRYRPADEETTVDAGVTVLDHDLLAASSRHRFDLTYPLSADDIAEAAFKVAPEALEAAVLEHEEGFDLDAETLVQLADAGVRPGLIDLMVALSFPEQFEVRSGDGSGGGFALPGTFYGPRIPYSYGAPYYLTPFSYYYWYAPHHPRYVLRPIAVREVRQGLVSSRGYAQVSPRPSDRRAKWRAGSGDGDSGSYSAGSGGSSSGGTVSGQGYTRGGSSRGSAKPRKK